jgi:phosphatidylglycerophosphate synthase
MLLWLFVCAGAALMAREAFGLSDLYAYKALGLGALVMVGAFGFLADHHQFQRFGPANHVTTARGMAAGLLAGFIGEPGTELAMAGAASLALLTAVLDGVDGWLARRTGLTSDFGARFDMEVDALLIVVLSVLAWRYDKAGAWVLCSGLMRYVFVASGWQWTWLRRPLPPSWRRQAGCVIQTVALGVALLPFVPVPLSSAIAAIALLQLSASFVIDVLWLWQRSGEEESVLPGRLRSSLALATAVVLLNASLTFQNVWPTPLIYWKGDLSIELAGFLLALALAGHWLRPGSWRAIRFLAILWLALAVGRYAEVTSFALYGREVNLYWDLRYIPDVAAMLAKAAPLWIAAAAAVAVVLMAMYLLLRWALGRVSAAMTNPSERLVLAALSAAAVMLFIAERPSSPNEYKEYRFTPPVFQTYLRQARLAAHALGGSKPIARSPSMDSDLSLVGGADVFFVFVESYGAVTYDRPEFAAALAGSRAGLETAVRESGRGVVSAFVESPTFGGGSWLAHISLLSGIEVRDPDTNASLMTENRDTVVSAFRRRGYRTIALMPGLWNRWPEGEFYHFDEIYDGPRLDYRGPELGWWAMSDQFALARLDALEVSADTRAPLFVFFPTVSTHTPFSPTPPYQSDWRRMLGTNPYDESDLLRMYSETPDWLNLGPSYVNAVAYAHASVAGYLRLRENRDVVLVIIGDHQPPSAVTGEGASWDVPVHVVASRKPILDRLLARGFRRGLTPERSRLTRMHDLLPILLEAFGNGSQSELARAD